MPFYAGEMRLSGSEKSYEVSTGFGCAGVVEWVGGGDNAFFGGAGVKWCTASEREVSCRVYSLLVIEVCGVVYSTVDTGVVLLVLGGDCGDRGSTGSTGVGVLCTMLMV